MTLGRKILNLRLDRGIHQMALAEEAGVTPGCLSKIESDENLPRGRILFRIARALQVPCDYLIDEEMPYPYSPPRKPDLNDPGATVKKLLTQDEHELLLKLRKFPARSHARQLIMQLPYLPLEQSYLLWIATHRFSERETAREVLEAIKSGAK